MILSFKISLISKLPQFPLNNPNANSSLLRISRRRNATASRIAFLALVPFRGGQADCPRAERNLCGVAAAAVVPSAIHAPLTGLFFIATAPERSTQAAERFSPPGNGDTRKQGRKGSVLGKSVRAAGGFAVENQSPVRSCKQG